jgi:hypothetical protein
MRTNELNQMGREDDPRRWWQTGDLSRQDDEDEAATMTDEDEVPSSSVPLRCADERRNLRDPVGGSFLAKQASYMHLWGLTLTSVLDDDRCNVPDRASLFACSLMTAP